MGPRKIFKGEILRRLENAILRLVFANTVFHERAMLLISYAEYAQSLLDIISHQEPNMGPPCLGLEKIFQNEVLRRQENVM